MVQIITVANIAAIDLNLLVVLQALLEERSATRAAKRLGVTQSAVSNALARLRDSLQDPLLVRHARGLTPTPKAEALAPRLSQLLRELGKLIESEPAFDPATSTREFTLACADYYGVVVMPPLTQLLRERAPRARLRLLSLDQLVHGTGLRSEVDVHVGRPPEIPSGCLTQDLFEERFVCLTRPGARPRTRLSLREYREASHVRVRVLDRARDPIDEALAKRGLQRKVALTVPNFALAPWAVLRSGLVATLSERLASVYAEFLPLEACAPPIRLRPQPVRMIWDRRSDSDPGARFFRSLVVEASR